MNYNLSRPIQLTQAEHTAALDALHYALEELGLTAEATLARILDAINRTAAQANSPTPKHPAPQPDSPTNDCTCGHPASAHCNLGETCEATTTCTCTHYTPACTCMHSSEPCPIHD